MSDTNEVSTARVCVGVVTGAHGLHGLVRIRPFTDVPEDVGAYGPVESEDGSRTFVLEVRNRAGKGQILVHVDGVDDRNAAESLKSLKFFVPRDRLPEAEEDEFYHADLVGLSVVGESGDVIGNVRAVQNFGGGDMLEINESAGCVAIVPFTQSAVPQVDIKAGRVVVDSGQILRQGTETQDENRDDG